MAHSKKERKENEKERRRASMWGWAHVLAIQPPTGFSIFRTPRPFAVCGWKVVGCCRRARLVTGGAAVLFHFLLFTSAHRRPPHRCVFSARLLSIQRHFSLGAQSSVTRFPYEPSQAKPGQERLSGSPFLQPTHNQGALMMMMIVVTPE